MFFWTDQFLVLLGAGLFIGLGAIALAVASRLCPVRIEIMHLTPADALDNTASERRLKAYANQDQQIHAESPHVSVAMANPLVVAAALTAANPPGGGVAAAQSPTEAWWDQLPDGCYFCSAQGQLFQANRALARQLGYDSAAELVAHGGETVRDWYRDANRFAQICEQLREQRQLENCRSAVKIRGGETLWWNEHLRGQFDETGKLVGYFATVRAQTNDEAAEHANGKPRDAWRKAAAALPTTRHSGDPNRALAHLRELLDLLAGTDLSPKAVRYVQSARDSTRELNAWWHHDNEAEPPAPDDGFVMAATHDPLDAAAEQIAAALGNGAATAETANQRQTCETHALITLPCWTLNWNAFPTPIEIAEPTGPSSNAADVAAFELSSAQNGGDALAGDSPNATDIPREAFDFLNTTEYHAACGELPEMFAVEQSGTPPGSPASQEADWFDKLERVETLLEWALEPATTGLPAEGELRAGDARREDDGPRRRRDDGAVDWRALLRRCEGDVEFARRMLTRFTQRVPQLLAALEQALGAHDFAAAARFANLLRSIAANLAAENLRALVADLESASREESWTRADLLLHGVRAEAQYCLDYARQLDAPDSPLRAGENATDGKTKSAHDDCLTAALEDGAVWN